MDLIDIILNQTDEEYEARHEYIFYRRAIEAKLLGKWANVESDVRAAFLQAHPTAREIGVELDAETISHLVRFPYESDSGYAQRYALAADGGESQRVLAELIGHIMRAGYTLSLDGFADEVSQKLLTDIDNYGTDFAAFASDVATELAGVGRAVFITQANDFGIYTQRIKREDVRDSETSGDGLSLIIYDDFRSERVGYELKRAKLRVLISPAEWIFTDVVSRKIISRVENPLGVVPVASVYFGNGEPPVKNVARLQYLLMNAESVLAQKIRNQAISILNGPTGIREQLKTLSVQKVIELPPDSARGLEWAAYPAAGLDGDFRYLQLLIQRIATSGMMRMQIDAPQSGEAKAWDFLSQKSLLEQIATGVENCINKILTHWEMYANVPHVNNRFTLNRNYDVHTLRDTLQLIFEAMTLQLGETVETKLRMTARDALAKLGVALTPEERAQSDAEITERAQDEMNAEYYAKEILKQGAEVTNENT